MRHPLWSWSFETRDIPALLLPPGGLAAAARAAQALDALVGHLLEPQGDDRLSQVLARAPQASALTFTHRGGGRFVAYAARREDLQTVQTLWHAELANRAASLHFCDRLRPGPQPLAADPSLPTARTPGAWRPAAQPWGAPVQATTRAATPEGAPDQAGAAPSLPHRMAPCPDLQWLTALTLCPVAAGTVPFPFQGRPRDLALVQTATVGLTPLLQRLAQLESAESWTLLAAKLTHAVAVAARHAMQVATAEVLHPADADARMPARPLLVSDTEGLLLVRADLAQPFAEAYLRAFAADAQAHLRPLAAALVREAHAPISAVCGVLSWHGPELTPAAIERVNTLCQHARHAVELQTRLHPTAEAAFATAQAHGVNSPHVTLTPVAPTHNSAPNWKVWQHVDLKGLFGISGVFASPENSNVTKIVTPVRNAGKFLNADKHLQGYSLDAPISEGD